MTPMTTRGRAVQVAAVAATLAVILVAATASSSATWVRTTHEGSATPTTTASRAPAVIGSERIGTSVRGRAIRAYHLGDPEAAETAVVLGSMHGNEPAGMHVVGSLRQGRPVVGVDLWVIPTMNPDGVARNSRANARGVDLNRNFRHNWAPLTGSHYSGPRPLSEPESRALVRFLNHVSPTYVVSFHQPLHGVGRDNERRPFQRRLARGLGLAIKAFNCEGECHGTMTSWYNARHRGTAITVEFGPSPRGTYLRGRATRGTLSAVLGSRA